MITRRNALGATALVLASTREAGAASAPKRKATYVLVHGAGSGGWTWGKVAPLLRQEGHDVYTPTLTGVGERTHLLRADTGLETHIEDILGVLHYEDLSNVILLGHSYGGMVVTGVADRALDRIGQLVYCDAAIPRDGESMVDVTPMMMEMTRKSIRVENGIQVVLGPQSEAVKYVGSQDPEITAWKKNRYSSWPWKAFADKLQLAHQGAVLKIPRTNINCIATMRNRTPEQAARARDADRVWELDTTHDLMITEPQKTADMLLKLAAL
jgi:pimeloyl-ACP methyl ester carboxylesterase